MSINSNNKSKRELYSYYWWFIQGLEKSGNLKIDIQLVNGELYFNLFLYELSSHNRTIVSSSWSNLVQWRLKWVWWFKCWSSLNSSLLHMASSRWLEAQENDLWQSVSLSPHQCQFMYCFPIIPPDSKRTAFCRHKLSLLYNSMRNLSSTF